MLKLGLYEKSIYTIPYKWNSKNTPEPDHGSNTSQPIIHPTTKEVQVWMANVITSLQHLPIFLHMSFRLNMSHILQQFLHLKLTGLTHQDVDPS